MDLDDTKAEGVVFVAQAVTGNGLSADSETASFTCHPTPAPTPHLVFPQDDDQIVDLNDTVIREVTFVGQTDTGGGTDSETARLIHRPTPAPNSPPLRMTARSWI